MPDYNSNGSPLDSLAGAFGHGVDRPGLNAAVATAQARNGLLSAQTEDALLKAQNQISEQDAKGQLEGKFRDLYKSQGMDDYSAASHAAVMAGVLQAGFGNYQQANEGWKNGVAAMQAETVGNPNAPTPNRAAADLALGHDPYQVDQGQLIPKVQTDVNTPTVIQTPGSTATQGAQNALAGLHDVQAAAGGFNPHAAGAGVGLTDPNDAAYLNKAVAEHRLNPDKINSRTAPLFVALEKQNGGTINYNAEAATANAQRNVGVQSKMVGYNAMPTILSHMTTLGKAVGYSDNATVGKMQKWMNGEFNDPAYTEYMSVRNDALMKIASLMRGAGMSDQAHSAEVEAASPTLSPLALDAWYKGQMASLKPYYEYAQKVSGNGEAETAANKRTIVTPPIAREHPGAVPAPPPPEPGQQTVDPNDPLGIRGGR